MTLTLSDIALPPGILPVNEIFETIQGEGSKTGTPAVFIRLQGCPVGCPWCDTRFTWERHAHREIPIGEMLTKDHSGEDTWAAMSVADIEDQVGLFHARHVVITGGEPALHDLTDLTAVLIERMGRSVQIETSGTHPVRVHCGTWVTVSPKIEMPGGLAMRPDALRRADEIKMPVGREADIRALIDILASGVIDQRTQVFLQPLSRSPKATDLCVKNAIANNWRVSLQIHALAGWR